MPRPIRDVAGSRTKRGAVIGAISVLIGTTTVLRARIRCQGSESNPWSRLPILYALRCN